VTGTAWHELEKSLRLFPIHGGRLWLGYKGYFGVRHIWFPPDVTGVSGLQSNDLMVVPSPSSSASPKDALRAELRGKRRDYAASLSSDTRAALEAELVRWAEPLLFAASVVAAYQPMKAEISPLPLLARAALLGTETALPAFVARDSRMTFRPGEATEPGPWGLLQPPLGAPAVTPDLIFVPLVGCDRSGNRIGMGQGHYDRALAGLRGSARLVGVGWDFQLLDEPMAADPWDQPLNAFLSPSQLIEFSA